MLTPNGLDFSKMYRPLQSYNNENSNMLSTCFHSRDSVCASVNLFVLAYINLQSTIDKSLHFSSGETGLVSIAD